MCAGCAPVEPTSPEVHPGLLRGAFALGSYRGPLGQLVVRGKRAGDPELCAALGELLAASAAPDLADWGASAVVPVPSPWTRVLWRGFQPTAALAEPVGRALGVPVVHALGVRDRGGQAGLGASGRLRAASARFVPRKLVHGRVVLVDDVLTTGATAAACAAALLAAGAEAVTLITVVTAGLDGSGDFEVKADKRRHSSILRPS